jgi:hypothetical protein
LFLIRINPWKSAGLTLDEIQETAQLIHEHVDKNIPYNVVLLDDSGDLDAFKYRYFLNTTDHPLTRRSERDQAKVLFVIDERTQKEFKALDSPAYEIVVFPDKQPVNHLIGPDGQDIWVLKRN